MPLIIGAGGGPKTLAWIARHADGWMTTPGEQDIAGKAAALRQAWAADEPAGRTRHPGADRRQADPGRPRRLVRGRRRRADLGTPGRPGGKDAAYLDRLAARLAL